MNDIQDMDSVLVNKSGITGTRYSRVLSTYAESCLPDKSIYGSWQSVVTPIRVPTRTGEYFRWDTPEFLRDDAQPRAPKTIPKDKNLSMTRDTFKVEAFACAFSFANEEIIENDSPFDLDMAAVDSLVRSYLIRRDRVFGEKFMNDAAAGTDEQCWTKVIPGTACQPDPAVCDLYNGLDPNTAFPFVDDCCDPTPFILEQQMQLLEKTGKRANVIFMNARVYQAYIQNKAVQARLGEDKDQVVGRSLLAKLLPGIRIVVSDSVFAPKGQADGKFTYGNHILLAHIAPRPSMQTATAIQSFQWSKFNNIFRGARGRNNNPVILRQFDDNAHCYRIQMHGQIGLQCSSTMLGILFQNVLKP